MPLYSIRLKSSGESKRDVKDLLRHFRALRMSRDCVRSYRWELNVLACPRIRVGTTSVSDSF